MYSYVCLHLYTDNVMLSSVPVSHGTHLDCGNTFPTNRNMAFSEGNWILLRMIHMNWATEMSLGTRNFRLSMSWIWDFGSFSTITCCINRLIKVLKLINILGITFKKKTIIFFTGLIHLHGALYMTDKMTFPN